MTHSAPPTAVSTPAAPSPNGTPNRSGRATAPRLTRLVAVALAAIACVVTEAVAASPPAPGVYAAELASPGGAIPFGLELHKVPVASPHGAERRPDQPRGQTRTTGVGWRAFIRNGYERVEVPAVAVIDGQLVLQFTHYGSRIVATLSRDKRTLTGEWSRQRGVDDWTRMPFQAVWMNPPVSSGSSGPHGRPMGARRGPLAPPATDAPGPAAAPAPPTHPTFPVDPLTEAFAGRWSVDFSSSDEPAVGEFTAGPGGGRELAGTFLTTVGDYRFLGGSVDADGRTMRLHVFDGAHAFLFVATRGDDGTLAGDFWSRDVWHETWTARRDASASLPDGFGLTAWNADVDLGSLRFPTPDGDLVALDDARFAGRPRIIEIFGTWCPNCNDATEYLVELHDRYARRGLSVLGLAFEYSGDPTLDAERVKAYARHHDIEFPILIAGTADKAKASAALPIVDRVRAYPTLIFMDADGAVRAIYTGFNGPATGERHEKLREDVERIIESMLPPAG